MEAIPEFLLDKYDAVDFHDRGAFGRVYKCARAGRTTAVKILDELDSASRARFKIEVDMLRRVDHENIVKLLDAGETDGRHWYESEFANSGHFGVMAPYLFYSDADRVKYFSQICSGVQALHELEPPIIHRDLKPRNILCYEYSEPSHHVVLRIADFGIAAIAGDSSGLTTTGTVLGTAHYMAPERVRNPRIKSPQSDIYSLGITFLEACTGSPIPSPENLNDVPEILKPIVEKMIRQRPEDRYRSVAEVREALNNFSYFRLLHGRDPEEDESGTMIFHVNISRELENALQFLFDSNPENVLERLAAFERKLDRLGDAHDDEAHNLKNIPVNALEMIEKANPEALFRVVQRFENAARMTSGRDFFSPEPDMWAKFLADIFQLSSHRPTKYLCLEGLTNFLTRFGNRWTKIYLYRIINSIEDPSYMEHLAVCLREAGREEVASLLDGVPDERGLDDEALKTALSGANPG